MTDLPQPDELPWKYKSDPVLAVTETNGTKGAEGGIILINGLTILDKELFVVRERSSDVEVYDSMKVGFIRRQEIKELVHPKDISSCSRNKCLYILDCKGFSYMPSEILRVHKSGKLIKNWSTGCDDGYGIFVTNESNVILIVYSESKLNEYSPDGQLIRAINLSAASIHFPLHAIKLTNGHYVVSHSNYAANIHRVCSVDADGSLMKSFSGDPVSSIGRLNRPIHLSVDGDGFVMVADQLNCRILILDSELQFKKEILLKEKHESRSPERILVDDSSSRIIVADGHGRILIVQFSA